MCQLNSQPNGTCSSYFITKCSCHDVTCVNNLFPIYNIFVTCFVGIFPNQTLTPAQYHFPIVSWIVYRYLSETLSGYSTLYFWLFLGILRSTKVNSSLFLQRSLSFMAYTSCFSIQKCIQGYCLCSCYGTKFRFTT